jgi:hypothetical protein
MGKVALALTESIRVKVCDHVTQGGCPKKIKKYNCIYSRALELARPRHMRPFIDSRFLASPLSMNTREIG